MAATLIKMNLGPCEQPPVHLPSHTLACISSRRPIHPIHPSHHKNNDIASPIANQLPRGPLRVRLSSLPPSSGSILPSTSSDAMLNPLRTLPVDATLGRTYAGGRGIPPAAPGTTSPSCGASPSGLSLRPPLGYAPMSTSGRRAVDVDAEPGRPGVLSGQTSIERRDLLAWAAPLHVTKLCISCEVCD